jgi:hypothetical protein
MLLHQVQVVGVPQPLLTCCWSYFGFTHPVVDNYSRRFWRTYCLIFTVTYSDSRGCRSGWGEGDMSVMWVWRRKHGLSKPYSPPPPRPLPWLARFSLYFPCKWQIPVFLTTSASTEPESFTLKTETVLPSEMSEHWSASWCWNPKEDHSQCPMFICGSCFTGVLTKTLYCQADCSSCLVMSTHGNTEQNSLLPATANPPTHPPVAGVAAEKWILQRADSINSVSGHSTRHITCCTKS